MEGSDSQLIRFWGQDFPNGLKVYSPRITSQPLRIVAQSLQNRLAISIESRFNTAQSLRNRLAISIESRFNTAQSLGNHWAITKQSPSNYCAIAAQSRCAIAEQSRCAIAAQSHAITAKSQRNQ
jgi:hypothetical protein